MKIIQKLPGIYKITNIITNMFYIGSAFNLNKRKYNHFRDLKENIHCNKYLQNSYNNHNILDFRFEILEIVPRHENETKSEFKLRLVNEKEQYYLDTLLYAQEYIKGENNKFRELGYNINPIAESSLGYKHTEETKLKMKISQQNNHLRGENHPMYGKNHSEDTKLKISNKQRGKIQSEKTKKKRSESLKGRISPNKNKNLTEETKKKLSESKKGEKHWNYGGKMNEYTKQKLIESRKGKLPKTSIKIEYNNIKYNSLKCLWRELFSNITYSAFRNKIKYNKIILKYL